MPTSDALCGLGISAQVADKLGQNYSALTGVGTAQTGAAKVLTRNVELTVSAGQTAVVLPATADVMDEYYFVNTSGTATTALVFVPSGHTMFSTSAALNGSASIPQFKSAMIYQYKPKFWAAQIST